MHRVAVQEGEDIPEHVLAACTHQRSPHPSPNHLHEDSSCRECRCCDLLWTDLLFLMWPQERDGWEWKGHFLFSYKVISCHIFQIFPQLPCPPRCRCRFWNIHLGVCLCRSRLGNTSQQLETRPPCLFRSGLPMPSRHQSLASLNTPPP